MLIKTAIGFASILAIAGCATTPTGDQTPTERRAELAAVVADQEAQGQVCEFRQIAGSLRRQRVCFNAEELARLSAESRRVTEGYQRSTQPPSGN